MARPWTGYLAAAVLGLAALPARSDPAAAGWAMPPAGYAYTEAVPCRDDPQRAQRRQRPGAAHYAVCADQMALFAEGLAEARRSGRLLLVTFGATWCQWCAGLQNLLPSDAVLAHTAEGPALGQSLHPIEIGLSTLWRGQKADIPSGQRVLEQILARAPGARLRAIPFIAVVDPADPARVFVRNIDDLALPGSGGHDSGRLRAILREAVAHVRTGSPVAAEPGWLRRKLIRWWRG